MSHQGWIGVDLDGTMAFYDGWRGIEHIGEPIQPMVDRIKTWLAEGKDVRCFTARAASNTVDLMLFSSAWQEWSMKVFGRVLPVTCKKDFAMIELWDDRAVQVIPNTGIPLELS